MKNKYLTISYVFYPVMLVFTTIIMIVLGCHIVDIQNTRIQMAINFTKNASSQNQIWFLTGGVKNALESTITEAERMKSNLDFCENIILDTQAQNTAENFFNFKKWFLKQNFTSDDKVVITTSEFHKNRAEKIFKGIFFDTDIVPYWNLDSNSCTNCWTDEIIHMRNVESDIAKVLNK